MELESQPSTELSTLNSIRVETALSRNPIHRLARKGNIRIEVQEEDRGSALRWKVSYNSEYGQPGPLAYKIDTLIVNRRIEEATRPVPRIIKLGSLHDICKELGVSEGKNKSDIKQSLYQNASAFITAKLRFRMVDGGERTLEAGFTRYNVIFTGEKLPDGRKADGVYIILNDVFIQVINGAMTRPLDYDYLKSLPPAPQRFYELLSYQMYAALKYDRPRAKLTYSDFCTHAPQTRHFEWERVRSQMNKIHRPHRQSGYIANVDFQQTADSDGQPDWIMLYQPGPKARAEFRAFTKRGGPEVLEIESSEPVALPFPDVSELEAELIQRGVTAAAANELVCGHAEEKIRLQMEILDWRLTRKTKQPIDDPAAYLVSAITSGEDGHAVPKGFVSKAKRQQQEEARQAKERKAVEEQLRKRQEEIREREEEQKIDAYWASLTPEQQAAIDASIKANADPNVLAKEFGPLKRMGERIRRQNYLRQLLTNGETVAEDAPPCPANAAPSDEEPFRLGN